MKDLINYIKAKNIQDAIKKLKFGYRNIVEIES